MTIVLWTGYSRNKRRPGGPEKFHPRNNNYFKTCQNSRFKRQLFFAELAKLSLWRRYLQETIRHCSSRKAPVKSVNITYQATHAYKILYYNERREMLFKELKKFDGIITRSGQNKKKNNNKKYRTNRPWIQFRKLLRKQLFSVQNVDRNSFLRKTPILCRTV